ncbi:hypothetical protein H0H92_001083 [Tricholoma furcatifolium]|nr:hypothetical protein H0H92_001083 [Tricholoma furcatifolium]
MVPTTPHKLPYDPVRQDTHEPPKVVQPTNVILWATAKRTRNPPLRSHDNSVWEALTLRGHDRSVACKGDWVCLADSTSNIPFPNATHTALARLIHVIPHSEGTPRGPYWTTFIAYDDITEKTITTKKICKRPPTPHPDETTDQTGDVPNDDDSSPTSSPTRANNQTPEVLSSNRQGQATRTPTDKDVAQPTSPDSHPPAPPYTQAASMPAYPQNPQTIQDAPTREDVRFANTADTPQTQHTIDAQIAAPATGSQTVTYTHIPPNLHFHKTQPSQPTTGDKEAQNTTTQIDQGPSNTGVTTNTAQTANQETTQGDTGNQQDAMTVDTDETPGRNDSPSNNNPVPPPKTTPPTIDPAFAPTPPGGFPYTQLGTDPTFLLDNEIQAACEAKPFPKIWARLWRGGYDEETQTNDILSLQRLVFQKTGQRPRIIPPIRNDQAKKGKNHDKRYNPPYHYLIYGISAEACETLTSSQAVSTKDTQAFFVQYNPPPPTFLCTIRGFHFNILEDESSPEENFDVDGTVLEIIQKTLRRDPEFEQLIRTRCTSGDSPNTFISALIVERHFADTPRARGDDPNTPAKKELRWNLYFKAPPPLKREGYYTLATYFSQKKYVDFEWGRAHPLAGDAKYHCVNCKAANHISKECTYLMVSGWHGNPAGEEAPPTLEYIDQAPQQQPQESNHRGGGGGGNRGNNSGGRRGRGNCYR